MTSHLRTHGVHVESLHERADLKSMCANIKGTPPPPQHLPPNPPCIYGCTLAVGGWQSCQNPISMAPDKIWIPSLGKRRCSRRLTLIIDGWRDNPGLGEGEGAGALDGSAAEDWGSSTWNIGSVGHFARIEAESSSSLADEVRWPTDCLQTQRNLQEFRNTS